MKFQVKDNSGAVEARLIKVLKGRTIGNWIIVSLLKVHSQSKVKKGDIFKALIIRTRKGICRKDGSWLKFYENSIVLVTEELVPVGSRVFGPLPLEISKFPKIGHLTTLFV